MTQDDFYLLKLLRAGTKPELICARLNISPSQLEEKKGLVFNAEKLAKKSGYLDLMDSFYHMAEVYQGMGEALKVLGVAFTNYVTVVEISGIKTMTPAAAEELCANYIVLRKFSSVDIDGQVQQAVDGVLEDHKKN